jgi:predicted nucleic acid-binding protein
MIIVSNTSPLINLAIVGQLDLLRQLYGRIIIPQAVYHEIVVIGAGQAGAVEVKTFDWIEVQSAPDRILVTSLELELDSGEAEAIALATVLKADLLLMDERKGRIVASHLGLKFIGLLGVLVEAKRRGLVAEIKPIIDELIKKAGFWMSQQLYEHVLQEVGEN